MRRLGAVDAVAWVSWMDPSGPFSAGFTGFDARGWADSVWVLHAMYERDGAVKTGMLNLAQVPGPRWRRLRWAELAARFGDEVGAGMQWPPSFDWLKRWPSVFEGPVEGSLDVVTRDALLEVLLRCSPAAAVAECGAFFSPVATHDFDEPTVYVGDLRGIRELDEELSLTPSNVWPADRSWLVYTDADLLATKVSGSQELIAALAADEVLETIRWERPDVGS